MTEHIQKLKDVKNLTKLSRSSIYLKVKRGEFPAPVSLGARSVGWLKSELDAWFQERIALRASRRKDNHE